MLRPPRRARALRAAARARWRDSAGGEAKQIAGTAAAQRPCAHGARGASQSQKHTPSEHPAPSSRQKYVGRHGSAPQTGPPALSKPAHGRGIPRRTARSSRKQCLGGGGESFWLGIGRGAYRILTDACEFRRVPPPAAGGAGRETRRFRTHTSSPSACRRGVPCAGVAKA